MNNPFAFIVGCPRSGTTLLQRMVDAHPQMAIVPEIAWIPRRYEERDGVTPEGRATPELVHHLLEEGRLSRYTPLPKRSLEDLESIRVSGGYPTYAELISRIFDRIGEERGKELVGNKTVDYALRAATLHEIFPEARFVHIVRDGRDVALSARSWRRAGKLAEQHATWEEDPVSTAALWWEWHVRKVREDGIPLGEDLYCEIRYETLVAKPDQECARLCRFLNLQYSDTMLRFSEGRERDEPGLDAKHSWKPPAKGLRDWRTQMSPGELTRFEAVAGDLLDELGYPRGAEQPSPESLEHAERLRSTFEGRPLPARWGTTVDHVGIRGKSEIQGGVGIDG